MRTAAPSLVAAPRFPRRLRRFLYIALAAAIALTALHYAWFRDSSLVRVNEVKVTGLTGPDADRLRKRLTEAGLQMTTLHVRPDDLRRAVESEPSIRAVHAKPDFPHALRIDVTENHAVAAVDIPGSGRVPIAGNGTLMPGLESKSPVPALNVRGQVRVARNGTAAARVTDEAVGSLIRVAAAAPPALLHRATTIEARRGEGFVVLMRDGPRVMFGDGSRLPDKWRAAAGVLASRDAQGADYVDVRLPDRPVAGGLEPGLPESAVPPAVPAPDPGPTGEDPAAGAAAPDPSAIAPATPAAEAAPAAPSTPAGGSPATATAPPAATPDAVSPPAPTATP